MREPGDCRQLTCAWSCKGIAFAQRGQPGWSIGLRDNDVQSVPRQKSIDRPCGESPRRCQRVKIGRVIQSGFLFGQNEGFLTEMLKLLFGIGCVESDNVGE